MIARGEHETVVFGPTFPGLSLALSPHSKRDGDAARLVGSLIELRGGEDVTLIDTRTRELRKVHDANGLRSVAHSERATNVLLEPISLASIWKV